MNTTHRLLTLLFRTGVLVCIVCTVRACEFERTAMPLGYERGNQNCSDRLDNDVDSLIDCEDPDCFLFSTLCGEAVPRIPYEESENPFAQFQQSSGNRGINIRDGVAEYRAQGNDVYNLLQVCHDFIDNDDDGQFDCGDSDCQNIKENCCSREFTDARCSDGIDNDQNGFTDCGDWTCSRGAYVTVCDETTEKTCSDGIDNDGDGLFDCRDDDCEGLPVCAEVTCDDAIDNDGDGTADCLDPDCSGAPNCIAPEDNLAACQDGIDNDGNGYTDCNDFSCSNTEDQAILDHCASLSETSLEQCKDGIDNDGNGYTDCNDFSCSKSDNQAVLEYCASLSESSLETCQDGIDNDANGYTDCDDFSCSEADDQAVRAYCESVKEVGVAKCTDGVDNDGNGYTDCGDYSCQDDSVPLTSGDQPVVAQSCPVGIIPQNLDELCQLCILEASFERCTDGIDNDGNGYTDCDDYSCARGDSGADSEGRLPRDACQETSMDISVDEATIRCTDGIDNDLDGFIDCEDWDCNYNPLFEVRDPNGQLVQRNAVCGTQICD
ncbi:MAG: hypothetical protein VX223_05880 [Myxococcota bacterium]|nr:hypothetical protein [Myxococcota bacterium]